MEYYYRCFIVCPFSSKYKDVINTVKLVFRNHGIWAETAEKFENSSILKKVCSHIDSCDFAVVDISENNPNVMLELGLLIARRKPAIILRDLSTVLDKNIQIPSDIVEIQRVEYQNTSEDLNEKLTAIGNNIIGKGA